MHFPQLILVIVAHTEIQIQIKDLNRSYVRAEAVEQLERAKAN